MKKLRESDGKYNFILNIYFKHNHKRVYALFFQIIAKFYRCC